MARHAALDDLVADLAERQHGSFALSQLDWCSARLAADRVGRGEWSRIVRGVYGLPGHIDEWTVPAGWCLAFPGAAVAGPAAAEWWRFDGHPPGPAYALAPMSCGARRSFVRRSGDLAAWESVLDRPDGCLRLTDPTRTLIDVAGQADPNDIERMVESALRRGLTSVARLRVRAGQLRRSGRRGPAQLLAVLDGRPAGGGADSDGEVLLLQLLRAAGLPTPVRQFRVGSTPFDLAWPDARVLVELDGATHRSPERQQRDARKQNAAVLNGWLVLRFTWNRIEHEPEAVVAEIRAALAR